MAQPVLGCWCADGANQLRHWLDILQHSRNKNYTLPGCCCSDPDVLLITVSSFRRWFKESSCVAAGRRAENRWTDGSSLGTVAQWSIYYTIRAANNGSGAFPQVSETKGLSLRQTKPRGSLSADFSSRWMRLLLRVIQRAALTSGKRSLLTFKMHQAMSPPTCWPTIQYSI